MWKIGRSKTESTRHMSKDQAQYHLQVWNVSGPQDVLVRDIVRDTIEEIQIFMALKLDVRGDRIVEIEEDGFTVWDVYMARVTVAKK
jgi:hypothetical protein